MKEALIKLSLAVLLIITLSGCQKGEDERKTEKKPQSAVVNPNNPQASEEEYVQYVDMGMVLQNIQINGQPAAFPMDLSALGDNLSYSNLRLLHYENNKFYQGDVLQNDVLKANVEIFSEGLVEEGQIYDLQLSNSSGINLTINNVTFGSTYEQITAAFGEPSITNGEKDGRFNVFYENSSDELLAFGMDQGQVITIILRYLPEGWRS